MKTTSQCVTLPLYIRRAAILSNTLGRRDILGFGQMFWISIKIKPVPSLLWPNGNCFQSRVKWKWPSGSPLVFGKQLFIGLWHHGVFWSFSQNIVNLRPFFVYPRPESFAKKKQTNGFANSNCTV